MWLSVFVLILYSVTTRCLYVQANVVCVAFIFCADTLLPGAAKQLPPTASSANEAFTAGMCGVRCCIFIVGIYCTVNCYYCTVLVCVYVTVCCFCVSVRAARQPSSMKHKTCSPTEDITPGM